MTYFAHRPEIGPQITAMQARSIGLKRCPKCETWKRTTAFRAIKRAPWLDGWCAECRATWARARYYADHEAALQRSRDGHAAAMADPKRRKRRQRAARKRGKRYRERNRDKLPDIQRAYVARVYADPERLAKRRANRHAWYFERGGREKIMVSRATRMLQRRFAWILLDVLRAELARREQVAKAERERRRVRYEAWKVAHRARWLEGDFDDVEPVFKANGHGGPPELVRLPARPLGQWLERQSRSVEAIAVEAGMGGHTLRRYTTGESATVAIEVVDVLTTRLDVGLHDIYDPGRWPSLYEVDPAGV